MVAAKTMTMLQVVDLLVELRHAMMVEPHSLMHRLPASAPGVLREGLFFIIDRPLLDEEFEDLLDKLEDAYVFGAARDEDSEIARVVLGGLRVLREQGLRVRTRRLILRYLPRAARRSPSDVLDGQPAPSARP